MKNKELFQYFDINLISYCNQEIDYYHVIISKYSQFINFLNTFIFNYCFFLE